MATNRTSVSARQAAKLAGRSVPTITRAIKNGRLSAEKMAGGTYRIDVAELERVYGPLRRADDGTEQKSQSVTGGFTGVLQAEAEGLREQLALAIGERDDLRRRLDLEGEERRRLTAALLDQRPGRRPGWKFW